MITKPLITILLSFSLTLLCFSVNLSDHEKLRRLIAEKGQAEVMIPNPGRDAIDRLTRIVSIRSVTSQTVNIVLSPVTVEGFINEGYPYQIVERSEVKSDANAIDMSRAMEWDTYPSYSQYDSIMRYFASAYPSICRLDTIGTSIKGKLILVLKISDNSGIDEPEPEVFYTSSIHGDETGGFVIMLRLCDFLLKNYNSDPGIKRLVDNLEIWINPLANPDGTYRDGDIILNPVRSNANGYDLNRNYPDPLALKVERQKETSEMMKFMSDRKFVLSANFHSGVEVINYPWDRWARAHPDEDWFISISRAWADTVHLYAPKGYMDFLNNGVTNGYEWYPLYGGRQDYMTYSLHGREVTVELDTDFITPPSRLTDLWNYNFRSLLGYIENALFGIHGKVISVNDDKPVPAMISIAGYDRDNSQVYTDTMTGVFTRMLLPGNYDISILAENYRDTLVRNVPVVAGDVTNLLIKLKPDLNPPDTTSEVRPLFYPNPGRDFITAVLPQDMTGEINIRLYSLTGTKVLDYEIQVSDLYPVELDVRNLAPGLYIVLFTRIDDRLSCKGKIIIAE